MLRCKFAEVNCKYACTIRIHERQSKNKKTIVLIRLRVGCTRLQTVSRKNTWSIQRCSSFTSMNLQILNCLIRKCFVPVRCITIHYSLAKQLFSSVCDKNKYWICLTDNRIRDPHDDNLMYFNETLMKMKMLFSPAVNYSLLADYVFPRRNDSDIVSRNTCVASEDYIQ